MGLTSVFSCGFDAQNDLSLLFDTTTATIDQSGTLSRTGKGCLLISALGLGPTKFLAQNDHAWLQFGYYVPSAPSGTTPIMFLHDSVGGAQQLVLKYNPDLSVAIYTGGSTGTTLLATSSPAALIPASYNFILIKALIANSGSCRVRTNSDLVINFTGDTQSTSNAWFDNFAPGGRSGGGERVDDLKVKIWSSAGDDLTTGPGLYPWVPTADSTPEQWTPSTGVNHYPLVNSIPQVTTTYIYTATAGNEDLQTGTIPGDQQTPAIPASPSVISVQHGMLVKIDSGSGHQIASDIESNIGTSQTITTGWHTYIQNYDTDPVTGLAWVYSNLATRKVGVKLTT